MRREGTGAKRRRRGWLRPQHDGERELAPNVGGVGG